MTTKKTVFALVMICLTVAVASTGCGTTRKAMVASGGMTSASAQNSQFLVEQISSGNPNVVRDTAIAIINTGISDRGVLDTLAEVVVQNYGTTDGDWASAIAYACKTLGASRNKRYYSVVKEATESPEVASTVRRHCSKAMGILEGPTTDETQYVKGMAQLNKPTPEKQTNGMLYTSIAPPSVCKSVGMVVYSRMKGTLFRCNIVEAEKVLKREAARRGSNYLKLISINDAGVYCQGSAEAFFCPQGAE